MAEAAPDSFVTFQEFSPPGLLMGNRRLGGDVEMADANIVLPENTATAEEAASDRLIIAVDFGTTFSSVAYAVVNANKPRDAMSTRDIKCISRYPGHISISEGTYDPENSREDVPTELWYNLETLQSNKPLTSPPGSGLQDTTAGSENDFDMDGEFTDDEDMGSERLLWGFGVQKHLKKIDVPKDATTRLTRFKLLLDKDSSETSNLRRTLEQTTEKLKENGFIEGNVDLIGDFLHQLFLHTKAILEESAVLKENMPIEFVLCVPAVWPAKASRTMEAAMCKAVKMSGLGSLKDDGLDDLFIVSEPEAAAACVLEEDNYNIKTKETIVIIDAGGGTIDAVTYEIGTTKPLRLHAEVVPSRTKLCGGSYINERYGELLLERLANEGYLEKNGKTIQSIVEAKVIKFENHEKRHINTEKEKFGVERVYIDDLQQDSRKRFKTNQMVISRAEMKGIFEPSLEGASELLKQQLDLAKEKQHNVQKAILIGGFGQSPALRARLEAVLGNEKNYLGQRIQLLAPRVLSTVVARGAALRAFDKKNGPDRITSCSYGFLITEYYEPEEIEEHRGEECTIDEVDGEKYIEGTIRWLIKKDDYLPHYKEFEPINVRHTFAANTKELICNDEVYVSDSWHPSHYRTVHPKNEGAERAGQISADMTFLKEQKLIKLQKPSARSKYKGPKAPKYWEVEIQLVMIVEGRNLRYEARWPVPKPGSQGQEVQAKGQISIAAAFLPGTA